MLALMVRPAFVSSCRTLIAVSGLLTLATFIVKSGSMAVAGGSVEVRAWPPKAEGIVPTITTYPTTLLLSVLMRLFNNLFWRCSPRDHMRWYRTGCNPPRGEATRQH